MPTHHESFSFSLESNRVPVAVILPGDLEVVVGSIVKLDGRSSTDPEGNGLSYAWSFAQTPIGSQVETTGFTLLEEDSSVVSFAPDVTGTYKIQLIVTDGSLTSDPTISTIGVRVILVPHHQGFIPDASFIWNYLSDFWNLVDGRKKFETFWSGAIQIVASEMLKLYQYDYAKSIRDVQEVIQKRWLAFSPGLKIDRSQVSFILADDQAGDSAYTYVYDPVTGLPQDSQPLYSNTVTVPLDEGNFTTTSYGSPTAVGRLLQVGGRSFTMKRSQTVQLSQTYGTDGASSGLDTFTGSMFTAAMEGSTLRIISHDAGTSIVGDYVIDSVTDPATLVVIVPSGATWAAHSDVEYSIIETPGAHSSFFADQDLVPTGNENQPWRFSSTLISQEHDFEALGSLPGDVVEIEITRLDINLVSTFFAQVVSVDRNRLGFVLNLEDLVDGTAAGWMTSDIQATLASDLQVLGLSTDTDGSLVYTGQSAAIKTVLDSVRFRRTYFEKVLTPDSEIAIGPFSIKARPIQVIRNRKIAVDPTVVSIPILQEFIKQPAIAQEDGKTYFVYGDTRREVSREPYLLSENLDYIIDDEATIIGTCQVVSGSDEIIIPRGDLLDRSIQEQDTISVEVGTTRKVFDIRRVVSSTKLRVSPTPDAASSSASFVITRRVKGTFIRFVGDTFGKRTPAPSRLWSEVTYFDNNDTIEANFGVMVGILREDLDNLGSTIPYKSSVAGLMYALSRGPTVANLELSAQILLGLPFTQAAGIVREINPEYRLRDDGSPRYGRLLIEGIDKKGSSTGITYIYLYPQGRQIEDPLNPGEWLPAVPDFSGLAINPDTDEEYKVGDTVRQFVPLSKGVEIEEYLTNTSWAARLVAQGNSAINLQKYHSFNLVVNADLVSSADVDLMAQFIKRAKAHYTRMSVGLLQALEDFIEIEDSFAFIRYLNLADSPGAGMTIPPMVDANYENRAFLSVADGTVYTRYLSGTDLETEQGSTTVVSAAGGFLLPRVPLLEEWDGTIFIKAGDLLSIDSGPNAGTYSIGAASTDTELSLASFGGDFQTLADQEFTIFRPLKNPIWAGPISVTAGNPTISTSSAFGLGASGVSVGDTLVFNNAPPAETSRQYTITSINLDDQQFDVTPDPVENGVKSGWIVRESLLSRGVVTPYGATIAFYADLNAGDGFVTFVEGFGTSWNNVALLRFGDIITINGLPHMVLRLYPEIARAYVTPNVSITATDHAVGITLRPDKATTPISADFLDRIPGDHLELDLVSSLATGDDASTTATSDTVDLTVETFSNLGAVPGDFLLILEGPDSLVDVGDGPGVFMIAEITGGGNTCRLFEALTNTGNVRYGIRRRVSS